jgi:hypothetical protein
VDGVDRSPEDLITTPGAQVDLQVHMIGELD